MCKLIKAEMYKLRKSIYYKVLLLGTAVYAFVDIYGCLIGIYHPSNGLRELIHSFLFWERCLLLCGILAGIFIGGDFDNRILHSQIAVGNTRKNIFLAKTYVYWIACIAIVLVYQSVEVIGITCLSGFGLEVTLYEFILLMRTETVYLIVFSGFVSVCILAAFALKTLFAVTATEIVWIMFGSPIFQNLANINAAVRYMYVNSIYGIMTALTLPLYTNEEGVRSLESVSAKEIFEILGAQHYVKFMLISIITILFSLMISYNLFIKTELK